MRVYEATIVPKVDLWILPTSLATYAKLKSIRRTSGHLWLRHLIQSRCGLPGVQSRMSADPVPTSICGIILHHKITLAQQEQSDE